MSIVGGVLSETILKNAQIKADAIWKDRIQKRDLVANVGVLQTLVENQTAKITPIEGKKDLTVEISWPNSCDVDDRACHACNMITTEGSTNMDEKTLDICRESGFQVNDTDFRNNLFDPEDLIANNYIAADIQLVTYLAGLAVAWLNAAKGINQFVGGQGTIVGNDTFVPAHLWDARLMAYLVQVATVNGFFDPYMISGSQLFQQIWNAEKEYNNADGKGNFAKFGTFKTYFDLFNIDPVNTPQYITYLVSKGAFALANKARYGPGITQYMDRHVWSMNSRFVPSLVYDVEYVNACDTGAKTYPAGQVHQFKLTVNAGMFRNPVGCNEDVTGILTFICGTGS